MDIPIHEEKWFISVVIAVVSFSFLLLYKLFKVIARRSERLLDLKVKENTLQLREEKEKLEVQKFLVETAKRSLTDSIRYAQRIQAAIIPTSTELKTVFKDIFVLFQPRDVISGDFYWYAKKDNVSFFAAVDCTGHGVPGAFMSLIGYAMLEQLLNVRNIDSPAQVLTEIDKLIIKWLKQDVVISGLQSRDGMDMALVRIDYEKKEFAFSGAKSPIFVAQKVNAAASKEEENLIESEIKIQELKADKFALGGLESDKVFTDTVLSFSEGDMIYLTSDGYLDQFGGTENKKYSKRRFIEDLNTIHNRSAEDQYKHLLNVIKAWKGTHKQIDDIMVIGIRL